jgi:pilus assembly protein CpaB
MKLARILVLVIALAAGGIAALLAGRSDGTAPAPIAQIETVEVLVASKDLGLGSTVSSEDLRWQVWPKASTSPHFIRKSDNTDAINQLGGSLVRQAFAAGEPIREAKLIKAKGSGYLAAILPQGKRAISTPITPDSGAGGFILPNDHVDVILSRRDREGGTDTGFSELILANVRVLAIDQEVEEKDGKRVVVGKTATLEIAPRQAETLTQARQTGTLSLALRSLLDASKVSEDDNDRKTDINTVRFGVSNGR